ncbi:13764_t:CDS:2, partial [Cetraspora pellucida]
MNTSYCRALNCTPYEAVFGILHKVTTLINNLLNNNSLYEDEIGKNYQLPEYINNLDDIDYNDKIFLNEALDENSPNISVSTIRSSFINEQNL